jgi:hypothetical protein
VEILNVSSLCSFRATWDLIEFPYEEFEPRRSPVVIPLNESEIAILGGCGDKGNLSDVVIFNVKNRKCHKIASGGDYKFTSNNN